jgi:hypothetical protein
VQFFFKKVQSAIRLFKLVLFKRKNTDGTLKFFNIIQVYVSEYFEQDIHGITNTGHSLSAKGLPDQEDLLKL